MKLKLLAPVSTRNWMLVAEGLVDPANWSIFLLNHGPDTDRYRFESTVQQVSAEKNAILNCYRLMCGRSLCAFEYAWQTTPAAAKAHAERVAELLSTDIELPEDPFPMERTG